MDTPFRLRPMELRDILDDTFDLYKENFALLTTITAIVFLPISLLTALVATPSFVFTPGKPPTPEAMAGMGSYLIAAMSAGVLAIIAGYIVTGALTKAVSERFLGRRITPREAYRTITSRFGSFVVTLFLPFLLLSVAMFVLMAMGVAITMGLYFVNSILGVLTGIALAFVSFFLLIAMAFGISFVMPVFVIEQRSGWDAVRRSFDLFRFSPLKVIGTLILVLVIVFFIEAMISTPITMILNTGAGPGNPMRPLFLSLQGATRGIMQSLFQPITITIVLLLYYDIRIRKEGFDLEVMANDLQSSIAPSAFASEPGPSYGEGEPPTPVP